MCNFKNIVEVKGYNLPRTVCKFNFATIEIINFGEEGGVDNSHAPLGGWWKFNDMRLNCELEVVYSLAVMNGGGRSASKTTRSKASVCLGKKPVQGPAGGVKRDELYLIVSTAKNVSGSKYKVAIPSHVTI